MRTNKISVIGLGKLGACTAACFALKGYSVLGVDLNEKVVNNINNGVAPVNEPGLSAAIRKVVPNKLEATTDYDRVMEETDITFIIVPSPSRTDGTFTDYFVEKALRKLINYYSSKLKPHHLFVIVSTLMPGNIEKLKQRVCSDYCRVFDNNSPTDVIDSEIEKLISFAYNPEFIAIGSVMKDFLNPDMVLIGAERKEDADLLEEMYKKICDNKPYIAKMSVTEAEITKLSLNCFVTMKISFANLLSSICEKFEGTNVDNITKALGADRRISPYYIKAGMPFGGTCFPRDVRAFSNLLETNKLSTLLPKAIDSINNNQLDTVMSKVKRFYEPVVAILGMSFKAGTPVIQESPSVDLANLLVKADTNVIVYDCLATEYLKGYFNEKVSYASSMKECFRDANVIIIATPEDEFKTINNSIVSSHLTTIIDCWRLLDPEYKWRKNVNYVRVGAS